MEIVFFVFAFVFVASYLYKCRPTKKQKEVLDRVRWQREVYGFELYTFGTKETGLGVGKHRKNATAKQKKRYQEDCTDKKIQESYKEWKELNDA